MLEINNQVYLNKFSLNISNTFESGLKFELGEILKGQVEEVKENGLVSINLKGKLIDALSTVEVKEGQELFLIVDNVKNGKSVLKVLTPENLNKMENINLSNTLKEMNLPASDKNVEIAKKLIQHNLPITTENIKSISTGVNSLNEFTPKNLELVGMAMAKGVPITREALEALTQFIEGESNLDALTRETVNHIKQIENNIAVLEGGKTEPGVNIKASSSPSEIQLLKQIVESLTLLGDRSSTSDLSNEIMQAIKTNLTNENELVRGLALVKNILQGKEMSEIPEKLTNLLINKIDVIEKELVGQKLSNAISKSSEDNNMNFHYLSFPVKFEDQYRLAQLKIMKNDGKKSLADMDNIKALVSLDTSNLGSVSFHVEWDKSSSLKIEGAVESERALKYIETKVNKLIKNLEANNYLVDYKGIQVSVKASEDMRLKLEEKTEVVKAFEIDILV